MKFQLFTAAVFAALAIASPVVSEAAEERDITARGAADTVSLTEETELALELALTEIFSIPDEVLLKGDDATNAWLIENGFRDGDKSVKEERDDGAPISARSEDTSLAILERSDLEARGPLAVARCIYAITKTIATTFIPAAKLLRIKKYLKKLGGVRKTVLLLVRAKTKKQRLRIGGTALVNLANELFGIQSIKRACSNL
ncbi:hypothetical protein VD0002_g2526 [Verticillium dahliae]|uniref:Uncharacterized protein n=2 Tax=Verticillium dahliae TaxID=27337 RepID=G2XAQ3_VERDV|nr:uncharacterized protein VDAG_07384 [Verticillium dahliae VdLs.17]KAF3349176.1 O-methyltransferase mdmC [Verticillium dahliae VDG2]KAH6702699.1 hypothetical protein EV126DRAFT_418971 [Verticillium dahliae]EGY16220.1 hypothetical protein VDAG_07384 [Verticillium dahliae VdLs.17]PNH30071.1 hypothetical protein BJF96_g6664 [Verticillium dahliae]PNH56081.1 hypothetical protein VD0003_g1548 [Verticillium dahliae]